MFHGQTHLAGQLTCGKPHSKFVVATDELVIPKNERKCLVLCPFLHIVDIYIGLF